MAKPLNNQSIKEVSIEFKQNAPKFQTMIEELFKTHIKSCSNLNVKDTKELQL